MIISDFNEADGEIIEEMSADELVKYINVFIHRGQYVLLYQNTARKIMLQTYDPNKAAILSTTAKRKKRKLANNA